MVAWIGPPDNWYDPPEPKPCCSLAEDDPDHDSEQCLADSAEAHAEAEADYRREYERDAAADRWER